MATLLIKQIFAWARTERLDRLVLHASDEGRAVYERLGFIQTSEMRFEDRLDIEAKPSTDLDAVCKVWPNDKPDNRRLYRQKPLL